MVFAVDLDKRENLILEFYSPVACDETREDMEERGAISTFDLTSEIHGYHVYKEIWTAIVGEERNYNRIYFILYLVLYSLDSSVRYTPW